ncbi:MAG: hypothetical protein MJE77_24405 [Proteobacteria bacterium]|nr:hypothetical protein [Pseudomonadota bacterium]
MLFRSSLFSLIALWLVVPACEKQSRTRVQSQGENHRAPPQARSDAAHPAVSSAAVPGHGTKPGPRLDTGCLDPYAGCPAAIGLPAISADGQRVAVADFGPESARDEPVLTMRIVEIASGLAVQEHPILSDEDYKRAADPGTGEFSQSFLAELEKRARVFERVLIRGGYRPLTALGTIHDSKASDPTDGLRAAFDGEELSITDVESGAALWRRPVGSFQPYRSAAGVECGPFPVADITVWVGREPGVAVALVTYISSDLCAVDYPYLIWRQTNFRTDMP